MLCGQIWLSAAGVMSESKDKELSLDELKDASGGIVHPQYRDGEATGFSQLITKPGQGIGATKTNVECKVPPQNESIFREKGESGEVR